MEYLLKIHTKGSEATYKIKYKNHRFHAVQHISGKVNQQQHEKLLMLAPQLEQAILILQDEYEGRVTWEPIVKEQSTYTKFLNEYTKWYEAKFNVPVIIKASDGATIKWMISNLTKVAGSEADALVVWQLLFSKWHELDEWYQNQTDLLQIKKNLNIILKQLKHGKTSEQTNRNAHNVSDDYRQKF